MAIVELPISDNGSLDKLTDKSPSGISTILSPLRYPGSKRRLVYYIKKAFELNELRPQLFVEPFAGGASVALQLLTDKVVEKIGLIDKDPLLAAFWNTVFFDADWLIKQVEKIDVTLDQWSRFKSSLPKHKRQRALACLFLNRTSFSGILAPGAGPIGGKQQKSDYGIACRFPREKLIKRIRQAEALKDRVAFVWQTSWQSGLKRVRGMQERCELPSDVFYYLDPPFFQKANRLYTHYFDDVDHKRLRDAILGLEDDWLLSYDSPERAEKLYSDAAVGAHHIETVYTTSAVNGRGAAKEIILSNLEKLPIIETTYKGNRPSEREMSTTRGTRSIGGRIPVMEQVAVRQIYRNLL